MIRYATSYRETTLDDALARAQSVAGEFGITRVTDITRLDRAGVPVFASVRPNACEGSLCVNAGKGLSTAEARVGAYMEAIEFACAEPGRACVGVQRARVKHVLDGDKRADAILDLCPLVGTRISTDETMACVAALDVDERRALVPAELVLYPYVPPHGRAYFGTTTNGLASGSSVVEATVHALFEAIERDISSAELFRHSSRQVDLATIPALHAGLVQSIRDSGLDVAVRFAENQFGVAWLWALIWDPAEMDPVYATSGCGCHLDPDVALARAITEAAQTRLSFIHGARDDLTSRHQRFEGWSAARRRNYATKLVASARRGRATHFRRIQSDASQCSGLEDVLLSLTDRLARQGMRRVLRVVLSDPRDPVCVVRVIVPLLEYFAPEVLRVGRRLRSYVAR